MPDQTRLRSLLTAASLDCQGRVLQGFHQFGQRQQCPLPQEAAGLVCTNWGLQPARPWTAQPFMSAGLKEMTYMPTLVLHALGADCVQAVPLLQAFITLSFPRVLILHRLQHTIEDA